ncbi:MAG: 1-deoxy-D-xylulose-5-phosphate reductoisomerase, partial [Parvibaculales bacterium]
MAEVQTVSIFGASGKIGDNVLDIISQHKERYNVKILTAKDNVEKLADLAAHWQPDFLVIDDEAKRDRLVAALPDFAGEILCGAAGLVQAAKISVDLAVMAVTGFAALAPTFELIRQGARIVLANKECLVAGGALLMETAQENGAEILPADSEHNGIFQLLQGHKPTSIEKSAIEKIVLTASGGPFRTTSLEALRQVTPEMAIAHPNWDMGAKISVDSATMMNKGLELIEAQHLFALAPEQCDV